MSIAERNEQFTRVAVARGVPFAQIGMRVEMDGKPGVLVGSNGSNNFMVIFPGRRFARNCHPNWRMKYFESDGELLKEFGD